jgi:hypothetical protein
MYAHRHGRHSWTSTCLLMCLQEAHAPRATNDSSSKRSGSTSAKSSSSTATQAQATSAPAAAAAGAASRAAGGAQQPSAGLRRGYLLNQDGPKPGSPTPAPAPARASQPYPQTGVGRRESLGAPGESRDGRCSSLGVYGRGGGTPARTRLTGRVYVFRVECVTLVCDRDSRLGKQNCTNGQMPCFL